MEEGRTTPSIGTDSRTNNERLVAAFASALRNGAIYPASHPRISTAADQLIQQLAVCTESTRAYVIGQRGADLEADGELITAGDGQPAWLLERFREAGLRGVSFEPDCTGSDVVEFALALNRARTRSGVTLSSLWPDDHPRLHRHDLVFTGSFREAQRKQKTANVTDGAADNATAENDQDPERVRQRVMERLESNAEITRRLIGIEQSCGGSAAPTNQDLDLLETLAELLPADIATQPDMVVDIVKQILDQVEAELPELVERKARVQGGDLLRMALGVARKYFQTAAPEGPQQRNLPSGRPEDAGIQANLALMLEELSRLPTDDCPSLPSGAELQAGSPLLSRELLGIHLHTLVNTDRPEIRFAVEKRLILMLKNLDAASKPVLETYLGKPQQQAPVSEALRVNLLRMLVAAGEPGLVHDLGHIDAAFIACNFPESLRLAARVLVGTGDLQVVRRGLTALGPILANGGVDVAMKAGVLQDPAVIDALLRIGGADASALLAQMAGKTNPEMRRPLLACLRKLRLPRAEIAAIDQHDLPESIPTPYLRDLLRAAAADRFDQALRATTASMLREHASRSVAELSTERALAAITNLQHVPYSETKELLDKLATQGKFWDLRRDSRLIRTRAAQILSRMTGGGSA